MKIVRKNDVGADQKTALVIRYGAFGDMIQASSILPGLKEQGYHVTINVTERGEQILKLDPHIDAWIIQETKEIPDERLNDFWAEIGEPYDHVVNLSESVEGTLLAIPGRRVHALPQEARHALMDINYLEFVHMIAGVPLPPRPKFYATNAEKKRARQRRKKMKGPVILWALAGSSVHKTWPHLDQCIARLMLTTEAHVVFVGDELCKILETGWEKEPRVWRRSGKWSIRDTLAFLEVADVVVGPETGVLNAAAMLDVWKVAVLSHSTHENLTRDWVNCIALEPSVPCFPCHRLHYTREFCPEDVATGASECAAAISVDRVYEAITTQLEGCRK